MGCCTLGTGSSLSGDCTLGDGAVGWEGLTANDESDTLGELASLWAGDTGVVGGGFKRLCLSVRLSCLAISRSAARTGSPAVKVGTVDFGGSVNRVIRSSAACLRWSLALTCGKGISCGMKVTVSQTLVALVCGK